MKQALVVTKELSADGRYLSFKVNGRQVASLDPAEALALCTVLSEMLENHGLETAAFFPFPEWSNNS